MKQRYYIISERTEEPDEDDENQEPVTYYNVQCITKERMMCSDDMDTCDDHDRFFIKYFGDHLECDQKG